MICTALAAVALTLCTATVPFTHNPEEDRPEYGQRVALNFREVPGMEVTIDADDPTLVRVYGHLSFQLSSTDRTKRCRNRSNRAPGEWDDRMMITVGFQVDRNWIDSGAKMGTNVGRDSHYHVVPFSWSVVVEPGRHEVRLMARAADLDDGACQAYFKPRQFSRMHVEVMEVAR